MRLIIPLLFVSLAVSAAPTFHKDVEPILQNSCQECHRAGEIGPMPLLSYEQARPWAKAIKAAVLEHKMPPWPASPSAWPWDPLESTCRHASLSIL